MNYRRRFLIFLLCAACTSVSAASNTILVVEGYHAEFAWDSSYRQALRERLSPRFALEFFEMNTKRLPVAKHPEMAKRALARIQELRPALVFLADDAALKYLGPQLDALSIPVVYLGINNNPRLYSKEGAFRNITGVLERPLIKRSVAFIRQIIPSAQKVLLLFDTDMTSGILFDEVFHGRASILIEGVEVVFQRHANFADWKAAVLEAESRGYQAIVAGLYQSLKNNDGSIADPDEVIVWTSRQSRLPLFGFWDFSIGPDKAIGGLVCSGNEQGQAAAEIAVRILERGEKPAAIHPTTAPQGSFIFSRKQLTRFGLKLPPAIERQARLID